jgi:hypothetical protein
MGERGTKLCDYTNTPNGQFIARPITTPEITIEMMMSKTILSVNIIYLFVFINASYSTFFPSISNAICINLEYSCTALLA